MSDDVRGSKGLGVPVVALLGQAAPHSQAESQAVFPWHL